MEKLVVSDRNYQVGEHVAQNGVEGVVDQVYHFTEVILHAADCTVATFPRRGETVSAANSEVTGTIVHRDRTNCSIRVQHSQGTFDTARILSYTTTSTSTTSPPRKCKAPGVRDAACRPREKRRRAVLVKFVSWLDKLKHIGLC